MKRGDALKRRRLTTLTLGLPAVMCIGASTALHAAPPADSAPADSEFATAPVAPDFKKYDNNGDGYVSMNEFKAHKGDPHAFIQADENKDGRLDADEFPKAIAIDDRIRAGKFLDDAWITTKVRAMLVKDVGLQGFDIGVETHKGIVQLSGSVDSEQNVKRASQIASGVKGVTHVQNGLLVKLVER